MAETPDFFVTVFRRDGGSSKHPFFTAKAGRHYAKSVVNNPKVVRITIAGPDGEAELFNAKETANG